MENRKIEQTDKDNEKPPFFKSWKRLYAVVLLNLIVLIILFYLFTKAFQ